MRWLTLEDGKLELRWTWLPYWMAASAALQDELEAVMRDVVIINGMPPTDDSLARIEGFVLNYLANKFPFSDLKTFLRGLVYVELRE